MMKFEKLTIVCYMYVAIHEENRCQAKFINFVRYICDFVSKLIQGSEADIIAFHMACVYVFQMHTAKTRKIDISHFWIVFIFVLRVEIVDEAKRFL